jgi:hypothetical protein
MSTGITIMAILIADSQGLTTFTSLFGRRQ